MAYIDTIQAQDATGAVRDMYQHQENHWGYVPNYAKAFGYRPEVMTRWGRVLAEVRRTVDDRRFELVTLAVALELKHSSCSLAHGKILAALIGKDNVAAIARGERPAVLTEAEVAMMQYARQIAKDANAVPATIVNELKEKHGLSDADVFDVAAIAAARCFFTKILDALGVVPDAGLLAIDEGLRNSLLTVSAA